MLKSTTNFHELFFTQVDKIQGQMSQPLNLRPIVIITRVLVIDINCKYI
jgi:hypothetical protein